MKTDKRILIIPDFMITLTSLLKLGRTSITQVHHDTKITYSHLIDVKNTLIEKGWVSTKPDGRQNLLTLTETGYTVVKAINHLLFVMGITNEDVLEYRRCGKIKKVPVIIIDEVPPMLTPVEVPPMLTPVEVPMLTPVEVPPMLTPVEAPSVLTPAEFKKNMEPSEDDNPKDDSVYDKGSGHLAFDDPESNDLEMDKRIEEVKKDGNNDNEGVQLADESSVRESQRSL